VADSDGEEEEMMGEEWTTEEIAEAQAIHDEERNSAMRHIREAVQGLMTACRYQGESGSEKFAHMLERATSQIDWGVVEDSHKEGLAYDCTWLIAEAIVDDLVGQGKGSGEVRRRR
jgi:hypothetical protein